MAADCQSHSVFLPVYFPLYLYIPLPISLPLCLYLSTCIYISLYLSIPLSISVHLNLNQFIYVYIMFMKVDIFITIVTSISLSLSYSASILSLIIFRSVGNSTYDQSIALSILLFRQCFVPPADYHLLYLICSYQQFTLSHTTSPSTETKAPTI